MCAGAMVNCKLAKLVTGVTDPRAGAAGSALNITGFDGHLHRVEVVSGLLQEECLNLLQQFGYIPGIILHVSIHCDDNVT